MSQENLAILGEICADRLRKAQQLMENDMAPSCNIPIIQYPVLPTPVTNSTTLKSQQPKLLQFQKLLKLHQPRRGVGLRRALPWDLPLTRCSPTTVHLQVNVFICFLLPLAHLHYINTNGDPNISQTYEKFVVFVSLQKYGSKINPQLSSTPLSIFSPVPPMPAMPPLPPPLRPPVRLRASPPGLLAAVRLGEARGRGTTAGLEGDASGDGPGRLSISKV